jgi:hypothetical protein
VEDLTATIRNKDNVTLFSSFGNSVCGPVADPTSAFDVGQTPGKTCYHFLIISTTCLGVGKRKASTVVAWDGVGSLGPLEIRVGQRNFWLLGCIEPKANGL